MIVGIPSSASGIVSATGGTVTTYTFNGVPYKLHTFTTVGTSTFTVTESGNGEVEYLIVGGGAGAARSGAGGAGAVIQGTASVTAQGYTVTVGSGGGGQEDPYIPSASNGNPSSVFGQTAIGGFVDGTSGNGFAPGASSQSGYSNGVRGGGGGAAENGKDGVQDRYSGTGGNGLDISAFLGESPGTTYKGGGGAGGGFWANDWGRSQIIPNHPTGTGALGGGGLSPGVGGDAFSSIPSTARGAANSGGGGAGSASKMGQPYDAGERGANGGSGIVYIRYRNN
jgi:hypothetical protein